uniref:Uncharacterized protein n=1 Tax=Octopus bimaculoides TaxID=37653 RepID=A0A0L8H429_OCTBM
MDRTKSNSHGPRIFCNTFITQYVLHFPKAAMSSTLVDHVEASFQLHSTSLSLILSV